MSDKALAEMFQRQEAALSKEIQRTIQNELKNTLGPMIDQKVRACVDESLKPVVSTLNNIGKSGVKVDNDRLVDAISNKVEAPLRAAFAENMKGVLIPAFEAVSGQMFSQISSSLEKGMSHAGSGGGADPKQLEAISHQLTNMTGLVQQLTTEVESLRKQVSEQSGRPRSGSMPSSVGGTSVDAQQVLEQEVLALLGQRQYEAAFTKALSASTVEMALFVCRHADLADVLGGNSPALSQPILLCLMHQLGTSVVTANNDASTNLQTELAWLQEISLSINPADESMRRHLPGVLQQLVTGINNKLSTSDQPAMRRPLQRLLQVLRGMQFQ